MRSQPFLNKLVFFGFFGLFLTACGGSSDSPSPQAIEDTTPPSTVSFFPTEDDANNFEVDYKVNIIFTERMNLDSLGEEEGIKLYSGIQDDAFERDFEERNAAFSFSIVPNEVEDPVTGKTKQIPATRVEITHESGRFALNNSYTIIIDEPARDLVTDNLKTKDVVEANYFEGPFSIDFITEKGEWKTKKAVPNVLVDESSLPSQPEVQVGNRFAPKLVSNNMGDTYLFWLQTSNSGNTELWTSRYLANSKTWNLPSLDTVCDESTCANAVRISPSSTDSIFEYDVALNEDGQMAIAWSQTAEASSFNAIWASLYDGAVWDEPLDISNTGFTRTANADSPRVAIDSRGNVVSIWREHENANTTSRIKSNIFKVNEANDLSTGAWTEAPNYINSNALAVSNAPKLVLSKSGLGIAVWSEKVDEYFHIYSNHIRFNSIIGNEPDWRTSQRIDVNNETGLGNSSLPDIAIDANDDALAVWLKHDGQRNNLWYARFVGSWETADYVERDRTGDVSNPSIVFGQNNKALLVWVQENQADSSKSLNAAFFDIEVEDSLSRQTTLATSDYWLKPIPAFDREGNAVVLWHEGLTKGSIRTSYYSKLTKEWGDDEEIGASGRDITAAPLLEDGRFLSVWEVEEDADISLDSALYSN